MTDYKKIFIDLFVGMPLEKAYPIAQYLDVHLRVVKKDGKEKEITDSYVKNIVEIEVANGDITAVINCTYIVED